MASVPFFLGGTDAGQWESTQKVRSQTMLASEALPQAWFADMDKNAPKQVRSAA
ncbi:MAG: hypothetical protein IJS32_03635 [Kiritimatiellae bacterium]|nr:hypothetical protein [Kiritimatiellia bacterium]